MNTQTNALQVAERSAAWAVTPETFADRRQPARLRAAAGNGEVLGALRSALAVDVGTRLRQARGLHPRSEVAAWLCVHPNTLAKIERGEVMPDAAQLLQLAAMYDRPVSWLLGDDSGGGPAPAVPPSAQAVELGQWLFVPQFSALASAGGAPMAADQVEAMRPFAVAQVRQQMGVPHNGVCLVRVQGAGMEPELRNGDVVLVDLADTAVGVDGTHLVRIDDTLAVRLLQRKPGQRLQVSARSGQYAPFELDLSAPQPGFAVLGRVRWAGVNF